MRKFKISIKEIMSTETKEKNFKVYIYGEFNVSIHFVHPRHFVKSWHFSLPVFIAVHFMNASRELDAVYTEYIHLTSLHLNSNAML